MTEEHAPPTAAPDARLVVLLATVLCAVAAWMVLGTRADDGPVPVGSLTAVAEEAQAGPVRLAALPHLVVSRTSTEGVAVDTARWGANTGALLLDRREQLVVLDTADPVDGARLEWCRSLGAFEHPAGVRTYGPDGRLLAGPGRRGMDRRALVLVGATTVAVDDDRWVSGIPRDPADTAWTPRGPSCRGDDR